MRYGAYQTLRNDVWSCLLEFEIDALPVDTDLILRGLRAVVLPNGKRRILTGNKIGACFFTGKQWYVLYDETQPPEVQRFTLAHEIGHILCGHLWQDAFRSEQEKEAYFEYDERMAESFGVRLLTPLCVLHAMQVSSSEELAQVCEIPYYFAQKRFARLQQMRKRNRFFEKEEELQIFEYFYRFILSYCEKNGKDTDFPLQLLEQGERYQREKQKKKRAPLDKKKQV